MIDAKCLLEKGGRPHWIPILILAFWQKKTPVYLCGFPVTSIVRLPTLGEQDPITSGHMQADKIDSSNTHWQLRRENKLMKQITVLTSQLDNAIEPAFLPWVFLR